MLLQCDRIRARSFPATTARWTTSVRRPRRTASERDADRRQHGGQVPGHGVAGDRLVHGEHDAVAQGPESGARRRATIATTRTAATSAVTRRYGAPTVGGRQQRDGCRRDGRNRDCGGGCRRVGHGRRLAPRTGEVVRRQRHARRGRRHRDDRDRGHHVDRQPRDHADENHRETQEQNTGRGKRASNCD